MRFPIPLVIEIPDDQLAAFADRMSLPRDPRAKDAVEAVRSQALEAVRAHFKSLGVSADVTVKR